MEEQNNKQNDQNQKSSTGLEENVAGLLCYLGTFVTGLIFALLEKNSHFVKFHAMQSIVLYVFLFIARYIVDFVPFIGWLLKTLLSLLGLVLWIVLMVKAYQKELYKLPVIGNIADNFVDKFNTNQNANA